MTRRRAILFAALLLAAPSLFASDVPLTVRVRVRGFAPSDVLVAATISPDVRNRSLDFVIESDDYYMRSVIDLEGDRAPRINEATFRSLQIGEYVVRVSLVSDTGHRTTVTRSITVR